MKTKRLAFASIMLIFILSACNQSTVNPTPVLSTPRATNTAKPMPLASPTPTTAVATQTPMPVTPTADTPTSSPTSTPTAQSPVGVLTTGTPSGVASLGTPVEPTPFATPAGSVATGAPAGLPNTSGSGAIQPPQYYAPLDGANYVSKDSTIIVRYGPDIPQSAFKNWRVSVQGTQTGSHTGKTILADDHKTLIFKPDQPFTPGEQVKVQVTSLQLGSQTTYGPLVYTFNVATNQQPGTVTSTSVPNTTPPPAFPNYLTLPKDIPHFTVSQPSPNNGEGDIFVAPFYWGGSTVGSYLLILDGQGQIVYYKSMANDYAAFDFKELPNGLLAYYDQKNHVHYVMNSHYQVVGSYQAQNGYLGDLHDFLLTPDGYSFIMVDDQETVDMSKIVAGGKPDAQVTGLVIQELDPSKNVIFQWRSWDHFSFTDSLVSLTDKQIDLVHGNAVAITNDGNLLLSSRDMSEITKINLRTGAIIWRLGGKANQFKFVNDQGFDFQHDVKQLPNGDITLFDNHGTDENPTPSRGVEYRIDTQNMTATRVWQYIHNPPIFTDYMGNTQRLSDGNTFMGWGDPFHLVKGFSTAAMTEVDANNQIIFQLSFDSPYVSYRAFRFPWQGYPLTKPDLASQQNGNELTLGYSWNGATEVASWKIYGGTSQSSLNLVDQKAKNGFETQSHLTNLPAGECYFQAAAIDQSGKEMARSKVISTDPTTCPLSP